jgi:nicotinate-nucleotide pyrophosphorylase (carboxylating)
MAQRPHWLLSSINADCTAMLRAHGLSVEDVTEIITMAISEDLEGGPDVTTVSTVPRDQVSVIELTARAPGIVAGAVVAAAVFDMVTRSDMELEIVTPDGVSVNPGDVILRVKGKTLSLLTAERTALNFLGHLSGIATLTSKWVEAIAGTDAKIRDTRKTTPGMRRLEKWAVRCGGGMNHRMSLGDAALIKDNHVIAAGGVVEAFEAVRKRFPEISVEVEVDTLEQLYKVVEAGADLVLLDNFDLASIRTAVEWNAGRAKLEASGGLTIETAPAYAALGVDYLAVGALTHSAPVLDIGADLHAVTDEEAADVASN